MAPKKKKWSDEELKLLLEEGDEEAVAYLLEQSGKDRVTDSASAATEDAQRRNVGRDGLPPGFQDILDAPGLAKERAAEREREARVQRQVSFAKSLGLEPTGVIKEDGSVQAKPSFGASPGQYNPETGLGRQLIEDDMLRIDQEHRQGLETDITLKFDDPGKPSKKREVAQLLGVTQGVPPDGPKAETGVPPTTIDPETGAIVETPRVPPPVAPEVAGSPLAQEQVDEQTDQFDKLRSEQIDAAVKEQYNQEITARTQQRIQDGMTPEQAAAVAALDTGFTLEMDAINDNLVADKLQRKAEVEQLAKQDKAMAEAIKKRDAVIASFANRGKASQERMDELRQALREGKVDTERSVGSKIFMAIALALTGGLAALQGRPNEMLRLVEAKEDARIKAQKANLDKIVQEMQLAGADDELLRAEKGAVLAEIDLEKASQLEIAAAEFKRQAANKVLPLRGQAAAKQQVSALLKKAAELEGAAKQAYYENAVKLAQAYNLKTAGDLNVAKALKESRKARGTGGGSGTVQVLGPGKRNYGSLGITAGGKPLIIDLGPKRESEAKELDSFMRTTVSNIQKLEYVLALGTGRKLPGGRERALAEQKMSQILAQVILEGGQKISDSDVARIKEALASDKPNAIWRLVSEKTMRELIKSSINGFENDIEFRIGTLTPPDSPPLDFGKIKRLPLTEVVDDDRGASTEANRPGNIIKRSRSIESVSDVEDIAALVDSAQVGYDKFGGSSDQAIIVANVENFVKKRKAELDTTTREGGSEADRLDAALERIKKIKKEKEHNSAKKLVEKGIQYSN